MTATLFCPPQTRNRALRRRFTGSLAPSVGRSCWDSSKNLWKSFRFHHLTSLGVRIATRRREEMESVGLCRRPSFPISRETRWCEWHRWSTCVCWRCPRVFPFVCQCRVGREGSFMLPPTFTTPCFRSSSLYSSVRFFPKTLGRLESFE